MSAPTAARRVTPTAVRVLPADADRDVWLAARRRGIGSSDVAAIVGASERSTALHVWHDKRDQLVDEPNEAMHWGTVLEDPVARDWQRRNRSVVHRVGLVANVGTPWMLATLDRRVLECPDSRDTREACALEVKCRNAFTASRWKRDVPDDVLAQTMWQMAVTGYRHIHVAVLIGGSDYRQTVVRWEPDLYAYIFDQVQRFRDEHLLPGIRPPADLERAQAYLDLDARLHPERVGEIDVAAAGDVDEYVRLSKAKGIAERALKSASARLREIADGARYVTHENRLAYELQPRTKPRVDLEALAAGWPDAYAATVTETSYHQIAISKEFRNGQ
jgi:putative phage-type endonuclease